MKMAEVAPGGYVGDIGLLGITDTRTVSVTAAQETMVAVIDKASFEEVVAEAGEDQHSIFQDLKGMQGIMADKETFCELRCFRKLEQDFVVALFDYLEPRLVYPGTVLMREGNHGNEMYILHSGKVRVDRAGKFITECESGVVLGELAVLGLDNRRTASVTATHVCFIYVLHGDVFKEILQKFPESKKVFDHAYIAKLLRHELEKSKDEKSKLDRFYGSAHPMLELEVQEYLSNGTQPAALLDRAVSSLKIPV
jgi:CRP-like cAMP-binding protein